MKEVWLELWFLQQLLYIFDHREERLMLPGLKDELIKRHKIHVELPSSINLIRA